MCIRDSNEAKYLEPPLPFQSFVRHISKHLPREVQITLMTREVSDINELEKILDVFQNIKDQEDSRCIQQPNMQNGGNYTPRGGPVSYTHLDVYKRPVYTSCTIYRLYMYNYKIIIFSNWITNKQICNCEKSLDVQQ